MSDPMSKDEQQPCGHAMAGPQPDDVEAVQQILADAARR